MVFRRDKAWMHHQTAVVRNFIIVITLAKFRATHFRHGTDAGANFW